MSYSFFRFPLSIFLIGYLLFPFRLQCQSTFNFTTINNIDGLPNNNVNDIAKDKLGFMWIATNDGLCRYESSNHVRVYKSSDPAIPNGLHKNNINSIYPDNKGNLWIGTRLGGLTRYHQSTDTWTTFRHLPGDQKSISNDEILSIFEDSKGQIWIGTENGLNLFHPETETFTSFLPDQNAPNALRARAILDIMEDDKGFIWVGTWAGGFYLLMPSKDGRLENMKFRQFQPTSGGRSNNVWKLYQDNEKRYWVGTHGGGLFFMDIPKNASNEITKQDWNPSFYKVAHDNISETTLSSNLIQDIFQDKRGMLWIGTINGLNTINKDDITRYLNEPNKTSDIYIPCKRYSYNPKNQQSITHNIINDIFEDDQGIIWISTQIGISQYNWHINQFENYGLFQQEDTYTATHDYLIDELGKIWITEKNGLQHYDLKSKLVTDFKHNDQLCHPEVSKVHRPDSTHLYIGTKGGLSVVNLKTQVVKNYFLPDWIKKSHPDFTITNILNGDKVVWLGTESGLFSLDKTTKEYAAYSHDPNNPKSISDNAISDLLEDSYGNIWVATYNGLNRVTRNDSLNQIQIKTFKYSPKELNNSISSNRLTALKEIDGVLYIGTINGLCTYDLNKNQFHDLSKSNNKYCFQSIEKTQDDNIWASTTEGIVFYNIGENTFNKFDKIDGIGDLSLKPGSSGQDKDGYLYFGSRQGITRFNPSNLAQNKILPPVYITDIKVMSSTEVTKDIGLFQEELVLNHDDYYLSIDFAGLNYNRSEKNKYAYKLIGFDKDWVYDDKNRSAVYTNLEAGNYQFHVKAANNDGLWNPVGKILYITVKPAFWETSWFRGGILFLFLSFIYGSFNRYTKKVRRRNTKLQQYNEMLNNEITERKRVEAALHEREQHMEMLVQKRTEQLEVKNKEVKILLEKITVRNEALENIVLERTKLLRNSNQELVRSNRDLEQFAYIASHDLQEPLRTIGSFVSLIKRSYSDILPKEGLEFIEFANDGVNRMSNLIKSLLTYSKVGGDGVKLSNVNLNFLVAYKLMDLGKKIEEQNVVIEMNQLPEIFCEKNQLGMVFYNLINNGIKFNKNEAPVIKISSHNDAPDGFWKFSIQDNGIGIAEKNKNKIFEIFSRLHGREYEGTGIGLALCQKIVNAHGGEIWLESELGKGTTFFLTINKNLKKDLELSNVDKEELTYAKT